jgi:deoxyribodipyrimidine photolyase
MPALLWFRRDLRLRDLPPLLRAAADSDDVLACFVLDPRLEASSGDRRMQFLCDSLRRLRDDLDGRLLPWSRKSRRRRYTSRRTSRRTADDATIGCARRWATCRWWGRGRRIWCRRDG